MDAQVRHLPERECAVNPAAFESALPKGSGLDRKNGPSGTGADQPPPEQRPQTRVRRVRAFGNAERRQGGGVSVVEPEITVGREIQHDRDGPDEAKAHMIWKMVFHMTKEGAPRRALQPYSAEMPPPGRKLTPSCSG